MVDLWIRIERKKKVRFPVEGSSFLISQSLFSDINEEAWGWVGMCCRESSEFCYTILA